MNTKNVVLTVIITLFLSIFIGVMGAIIYLYGVYDKKEEDKYLEEYNSGNFTYVYNNLSKESSTFVSEELFNNIVGLMYNKNNLKTIYDNYYSDSEIFIDEKDFFSYYFFGYTELSNQDIEFKFSGKTNLFNRRKIEYKYINLENNNEVKGKLGVISNVTFKKPGNGFLYLDNIELECENDLCNVDNILGGLHEVVYEDNDGKYYSLINVVNEGEYNISEDKSYIRIIESNISNNIEEVSGVSLNLIPGRYKFKKCYLESSCPSFRHSYMDLNADGTVTYYVYITLDIAGDTYKGTYEIKNNFLYLYFDKHIYKMHDYDTKQRTDIEATLDMVMRYKITSDRTFSNYDYDFKLG